jgi:hypothetical protein
MHQVIVAPRRLMAVFAFASLAIEMLLSDHFIFVFAEGATLTS